MAEAISYGVEVNFGAACLNPTAAHLVNQPPGNEQKLFHKRANFLHETTNRPITPHHAHPDHGGMPRPTFPVRGKSQLRHGRSSQTGQIYLVTFGTMGRISLFNDWMLGCTFARALTYHLIWRESRLHCWVLMPDHWHGLLEVGPHDDLSALAGRIKGSTARAVNQARNMSGRVWSEGFHDHAVRKEEDIVHIARYIVLNPVRTGIVDRIGQYPFWDAVWIGEGAPSRR